jgi:predicted nucleic acid-binding protein
VIVLDTTVVSELMRDEPAAAVIRWTDEQAAGDLWLTAVTAAELLYGVARLPDGRRKHRLVSQVVAMLEDDFDHQIAAFDMTAAAYYGEIAANCERAGQPVKVADTQIAAICRSHGATLATRNTRDFAGAGITVVNPWTSIPAATR